MRRLRFAVPAVLLLTGCTTADPNMWLLYGRVSYLYGRIEAKAESACGKTASSDFCLEAAQTQKAIKEINPLVQQELAKSKPDWPTILRFVDLVVGLVGKAIVP